MKTKILLIGGGTGGHILPLIPLCNELEKLNATVELVVADAELDREIIRQSAPLCTCHYFISDKIRRYLSAQNITAPLKITKSIIRAHKLIKKTKPDAILLKGGFVGFPFLIAKIIWHKQIKLFTHESDISPGALTKIAKRFATKSFESFGKPPRPLYYSVSSNSTQTKTATSTKPKLLILGGSQGAQWINKKLEKECNDICDKFNTTLISGTGKQVSCNAKNFKQIELLPAEELAQELQTADIVISRAGANSLFEIIAAKKPSVIIPLPSSARDHQAQNAKWFAEQGLCHILKQSEKKSFISALHEAHTDKELLKNLKQSTIKNSAADIAESILQSCKKK